MNFHCCRPFDDMKEVKVLFRELLANMSWAGIDGEGANEDWKRFHEEFELEFA